MSTSSIFCLTNNFSITVTTPLSRELMRFATEWLFAKTGESVPETPPLQDCKKGLVLEVKKPVAKKRTEPDCKKLLSVGANEAEPKNGSTRDCDEQMVVVGSVVMLKSDKEGVATLQKDGKSSNSLENVLGQRGWVKKIGENGILAIDFGYSNCPAKYTHHGL